MDKFDGLLIFCIIMCTLILCIMNINKIEKLEKQVAHQQIIINENYELLKHHLLKGK